MKRYAIFFREIREPVDRFVDKLDMTGDCWTWTAAQNGYGYGAFRAGDARTVGAHRFAYQEFVEEVPPDLELDHLCRNRLCVNPDHLEVVTGAENMRRGRHANREKTHCPMGHAYTEENTVYEGGVGRRCRICRRERKRAVPQF